MFNACSSTHEFTYCLWDHVHKILPLELMLSMFGEENKLEAFHYAFVNSFGG
jgi:hypothetical protein